MTAEMTYLVVPAAGQSKRFGLDRPKFLLEHPSGVTMLEKAILGLGDLSQNPQISKVVIISTPSHFSKVDAERLTFKLEAACKVPVEIHYLGKPTGSVVETLTNYLSTLDQDVSIVVKDSDNMVSLNLSRFLSLSNAIGFADLADFPRISAPSKSFMEFGSADIVTNFVEKRVISSDFSVGVTKFARVSDVLDAARTLQDSPGELYVSDIVRAMMQNGTGFHGQKITAYEDWGTLPDWVEYCRSYKNVFIRVEGVITRSDGNASTERWGTGLEIITENTLELLKLEATGRVKIVFISSRPTEDTQTLASKLEGAGFKSPRVLCGMHNSQMLSISEFSATNPYPSSFSINVPRNSNNLSEHLRSFV